MNLLLTNTQRYLLKKNKRLAIDSYKTNNQTSTDDENLVPSEIVIDTTRTQYLLDQAFRQDIETESKVIKRAELQDQDS